MNSKKGIEMSISKDLFLALLSMDAYNRGYGAGLELGAGSDVAGSLIGAAKIEKTIKDIPEFATKAEAAGFYAVAYKVGDGVDDIPKDTIVIALRGASVAAIGQPSAAFSRKRKRRARRMARSRPRLRQGQAHATRVTAPLAASSAPSRNSR